ncbi:MAG TPA: aminotransferase class V-fold PLP-dependent enzyme [Woeseiaceae bacterium]|nr:aminotransferase class V-fold PLP-dependent enzyme [Woeseiaceae bacterium]
MMLPNQRHLFEIPDEISYLNCAYMSPQLRAVSDAGVQAMAQKARPWSITSADFFDETERLRVLFAELVGGRADSVAIVPSVSYGIGVAAANVTVAAGQRILVLEDQFPSNVYPWMELASTRGAKLVTVPRPVDHDWTSALLECIDANTAVVAVPNCHWTDGTIVDLASIGTRARELGAALVVDATQSLGAMPLDVAGTQPDFLVAASYKWLLGPYSLGFLYANKRWHSGRPLEHNWIVRAGSENFGGLVNYTSDFQPGARRYDVGERSNFALLPMARVALRQILDWKVENIAETIGRLTALIESYADEAGHSVASSDNRAAHLVGLRLANGVSKDLAARLAAQNIYVSSRGDSLRIAPHLYNTEADLARLFEALDKS